MIYEEVAMPQEYMGDQHLILNHLYKNGPCTILDLRPVVPVWADTILYRMQERGLVTPVKGLVEKWTLTDGVPGEIRSSTVSV